METPTKETPADALARMLGQDGSPRIVVVHQDDVGMCHGANVAFAALAGKGFITSGSVMVPCPWFREAVDIAAADPSIDLGVHLTLTSEWAQYRWRPLTGNAASTGLVDDDGFMWRRVPMLRERVVPDAAEAEMRAQIETALKAGLDVTHLDTHMGAALSPELVDIFLKLGRDYRLPVLFPRDFGQYAGCLNMGEIDASLYPPRAEALEAQGCPLTDFFGLTPGVPTNEADATYRSMIAGLPPGFGFLAFHCNAPGDIEAIIPPRAQWRIDEFNLFRDAGFLNWFGVQDLKPVGYRAIRDGMRQSGIL